MYALAKKYFGQSHIEISDIAELIAEDAHVWHADHIDGGYLSL